MDIELKYLEYLLTFYSGIFISIIMFLIIYTLHNKVKKLEYKNTMLNLNLEYYIKVNNELRYINKITKDKYTLLKNIYKLNKIFEYNDKKIKTDPIIFEEQISRIYCFK